MEGFTNQIGDAARQVAARLRHGCAAHASKSLPTGWRQLDESLGGGIQLGSLNILAARPAVGKTAFALNLVNRIAIDGGQKSLYVTLREGTQSITRRLLCIRTRTDSWRLRRDRLREEELARITEVAAKLKAAPLHVCEGFGLGLDEILMEVDRSYEWCDMASRQQLRLVVLDPLAELSVGPGPPAREEELAYIMARLSETARNLEIAILVLASLADQPHWRTSNQPRPSDLPHFYSVGRYADTFMLVHRPGAGGRQDQNVHDTTLLLQRNRFGPTGVFRLSFDWTRMVFTWRPGP